MSDENLRIEKQKDGRHAVMRGDAVLGLHKSVWSAARQVHNEGGSTPDEGGGSAPTAPPRVRPVIPKGHVPNAKKAVPAVPHPKVPRP